MPEGYDTLDDVDVFGDLIELYHFVVGEALEAPDLCGVLTTGTLDQCPSQHAQWGGAPCTFGSHPEVWHVRSAPKGRIGMPLGPREVRKVSVLVRKSATHRLARITNIKMWRLPESSKLDEAIQHLFDAQDARHAERGKRTYGAMGMGVHGINLFAFRERPTTTFLASCGCQAVLSSVAKIVRVQDGSISKMEASMLPHYVVAASLAGFKMATGTPLPRGCEEEYDEMTWEGLCGHLAVCFRDELARTPYPKEEDTPLKLMMSAEDVYEQVSLVGYLDLRADPFFHNCLPEDMHRPSGLPLVLALSVVIAARPWKWHLPPARLDDAYATKEAGLFVESIVPSVLALDGDTLCGEQPYAFDLVMKIAHSEINEVISSFGGSLTPPNPKCAGLDPRKMASSVKETMYFLFCLGVGVCQDLFGLPPTGGGFATGQYTKYGFAAQLSDPMVESRAQSAYAMDLGNVVARWPTLRTSTRGRRQQALAEVLVDVNEWLSTGKYRDIVLAPTTEAPISVRKDELLNTEEGPRTSTTKSAKKKKRVEPSALLVERAKTRDANQKHYAAESMRSLFKTNERNAKRVQACSQKVCGAAMNSAAGIFCDVLQLGGCGGPSFLFEFDSYLISPTMATQCAHCTNTVHVVQSIALAPAELRGCASCNQPRCIACMSRDMQTGAALPPDCNVCRELPPQSASGQVRVS